MSLDRVEELKTDEIKNIYDLTGDHLEYYKTVVYPFDRYEINVQLGSNNEFIGVVGVKLNKDFSEYEQKRMPLGYLDVDDLYSE